MPIVAKTTRLLTFMPRSQANYAKLLTLPARNDRQFLFVLCLSCFLVVLIFYQHSVNFHDNRSEMFV